MTSNEMSFLSEDIDIAFKAFYQNADILQRLHYINPEHKMIPQGGGYNALPQLLEINQSDKVYTLEQCTNFQKEEVMCVFNSKKLVVVDPLNSYKSDDEETMIFHTKPHSPESHVNDLVISHKNGPAVLLYNLSEPIPLYHDTISHTIKNMKLSSQKFQAEYKKYSMYILNLELQVTGELDINIENENEVYRRNQVVKGSLRHTYAMAQYPALFCPSWSNEMNNAWIGRHQSTSWPNKDLVSKIPQIGYHMIPFDHMYGKPKNGSALSNSWVAYFGVAQQRLFRSLTFLQRKVLHCTLSLLYDCDELKLRCLQEIVHHSMLWFLEKTRIESDDIVLDHTKRLINDILESFENVKCPHYFNPQWNLFAGIPEHVIIYDTIPYLKKLLSSFDERVKKNEYIYPQFEVDNENLNHIKKSLNNLLRLVLLQSFDDLVYLMTLYVLSRNFGRNFDASIATHEKLVKCLPNTISDLEGLELDVDVKKITQVFRFNLQVLLARLFHSKAALCKSNRNEKLKYYLKSKEVYDRISSDHSTESKVLHAHMLFDKGNVEIAKNLLKEVLTVLRSEDGTKNVVSEEILKTDNISIVNAEFWRLWNKKLYNRDIFFLNELWPTRPKQLSKLFEMARCPVLGSSLSGVSVYSLPFFTSYLLALCHKSMRNHVEADRLLSGLVESSEDEVQRDLNDKRIAAYYIILGRFYTNMEMIDKAKYALHVSARIFNSPRSPVRWMLFLLEHRDTLNALKVGVKVAVVTGVVYSTYAIMRSHVLK